MQYRGKIGSYQVAQNQVDAALSLYESIHPIAKNEQFMPSDPAISMGMFRAASEKRYESMRGSRGERKT